MHQIPTTLKVAAYTECGADWQMINKLLETTDLLTMPVLSIDLQGGPTSKSLIIYITKA